MKSDRPYRQEIIEIGRRIHQRGWISATDGNISIKIDDDRLITTPTGVHKGYLEMDDFVITDMSGKKISGNANPSSEIAMHLACYKERPDIKAVIHAHPTYCIAMSVAGITLAKCLLPEVIFTLGTIPTADYAPPSTDEVPKSIQEPIRDYDAVILERHGSLTVGKDVFDAYNKLERMEHVAEISYHARQLGNDEPLTKAQVDELVNIRQNLGLPDKKVSPNCNACNACNRFSPRRNQASPPSAPSSTCDEALVEEKPALTVTSSVLANVPDELVELIVREVKAELNV